MEKTSDERTMLEIDELRIHRPGFELHVQGLRLAAGACVTVIGPSGGGKSTLLRALMGLEPAAQVRGLRWQGQDLSAQAPHKRPFGWMPQDLGLWPHLSALAHMAFARSRGRSTAAQTVDHEVLAQVGLAHRAQAKPAAMSGGERQRLAFARILASQPAIAVLDEPFSSLDAVLAHSLSSTFRALAQARDMAVVQVSHHLEAPQADDWFWVIEKGRLTQSAHWNQLEQQAATPWIEQFGQLSSGRFKARADLRMCA
jgi:ABC-type Fe3+/spermidine/putrescine transport system ATPase subunit